MLISRRNFFRISVLPAIASLAPGISIFGQTAEISDDRLMTLRSEDFRRQIGTKFKMAVGSVSRQAVLTDVKKIESTGGNQSVNADPSDLKCFSLTFQMIGSTPVEQATYAVRHGILGNFSMFLVPGMLSPTQPLLVAVINRSV
ncbi:MAG TPA: hypothetical protein VF692_04715 [Pyrinomonadaceae bacterium]|jgi:hypothetical protein